MSYNFSNYTQFGIKNDGERYAYAGWLSLVVIGSLLGDTTILVASIKYNAFNLQRIVVVVIQHIAVCDLINASFCTFPITVLTFTNSGGSNTILNYVSFAATYYVNTLSASLIAALSLGKLLLLKYPLRLRSWSKRRAHKICAGLWIASLSTPALYLAIDREDITFDYRVYTCSYMYSASIWKILLPIKTLLLLFIPNCIIIGSTVLLLNEARKVVRGSEGSLRWQGIMTVVLTATVYSVSFLPVTIYYIAEPSMVKEQEPGPFFVEFYRVAVCALNFNILANILVYSMTVTSFREFLKTMFKQTAYLLSSNLPSTGNCLY